MNLCLDISTTTIGIAFLDDNKIVKIDYVKPKGDSIYDKAKIFETYCKNINYKIENIIIESPIIFCLKSSSAKTISTLLQFNAICSYIAQNILNGQLYHLSSESARKALKIEKNAHSDNIKHRCLSKIEELYPQLKGKWEINRKGNIKTENYDMCDAIIIGLGWYEIKQSEKN